MSLKFSPLYIITFWMIKIIGTNLFMEFSSWERERESLSQNDDSDSNCIITITTFFFLLFSSPSSTLGEKRKEEYPIDRATFLPIQYEFLKDKFSIIMWCHKIWCNLNNNYASKCRYRICQWQEYLNITR